VVIIVAMVVTGKLIPPRGSLTAGRPPLATPVRIRVVPTALIVALVVVAFQVLNGSFQSALTTSVIAAIISLSLVVVTGYVGQISLAQMTFAGIGGFSVSKLAYENGVPFLPSILFAALIGVPVGVIIGLPALRVRGVNLAIVTIGAAVAIDSFVFQNSEWSGGLDGLKVPEPELFGWSIDSVSHPERFGVFALVVLGLCVLLVANLRHSRTGGRMLAVRDNERAAAANGINVAATKLQAFALSAFIAALGGALLGYQGTKIAIERFHPLQSIFFVAIAYIGGIASVSGALVAGLLVSGGFLFAVMGEIGSIDEWEGLVSGALLVLVVITQPDGIAVGVARGFDRLLRTSGIRPGDRARGPDPADPVEGAAVDPAPADQS
jgi:ABC-type branched-subunit amino acid transport system permease subunit